MSVSIPRVNAFCRKLDLVYVEEGVVNKESIHWFLDFNNRRIHFTDLEIETRLSDIISLPDNSRE